MSNYMKKTLIYTNEFIQKLNNDWYEVNCILSEFNYFLRVFELKHKF